MRRSWKPIFYAVLLLLVLVWFVPGRADARYRPVVMGTHGMVSSGIPLVSLVATEVLKKGGNAADAGITALFTAMVVEHTHHSLGGESAILYYSAKDKKVYAINGVGPAPKLATREYFDKMGFIPDEDSFLIAPVPGTLDGAVLTLDKFGTMKLTDAMQPAIDLAEKGHPIDHIMVKWITNAKAILSKWPGSVKVFLPGGNPPKPGDIFVQPEYAETLKKIRDGETQNLTKGRSAGDAGGARRLLQGGDRPGPRQVLAGERRPDPVRGPGRLSGQDRGAVEDDLQGLRGLSAAASWHPGPHDAPDHERAGAVRHGET